jgi:hypothetical protein
LSGRHAAQGNRTASIPGPANRESGRLHYIEMFYNRKRKHGYNDMLSAVKYEGKYLMKLGSV